MADVKINLEASHKDFVASLAAATQAATVLVKSLQELKDSHDKTATTAGKHADAEKKAATEVDQVSTSIKKSSAAYQDHNSSLIKTTLLIGTLVALAVKSGEALASTFSAAITNIDDFRRQAIGTAIAITNLSDPIQNAGKTVSQVFNQNLKATVATFIELETISRRYFASAADLQLAYNQFAQRGIVLGRANLEQLAQLTTQILLLTGGQNSAIQVQEEIRDLITGTLRPTAQLAQQIRSFGKDVKDVGAQIRALQNLDPLREFLVGTEAASKAIQGTFTPAMNGLLTTIRQVGRVGFEGAFNSIVASVKTLTNVISENKETIVGILSVMGTAVGDLLKDMTDFTKELFKSNTAGATGTDTFVQFVVVLEVFASRLIKISQLLILFARDLPVAVAAFKTAFNANTKELTAFESALVKLDTINPFKGFEGATETEAFKDVKKFGKEALDALLDLIPGGNIVKQLFAGADALLKVFVEDVNKITFEPFEDEVKRRSDAIDKKRKADIAAAKALGGGSSDQTEPTKIPFKASPEALSALKILKDELASAEDRLARAKRTAELLIVRADVAIDLQAFQKDLALLDQGFILSHRSVVGLRSALNDLNTFIGQNLEATVFGADANFQELGDTVSKSIAGISTDILAKTRESAKRAAEGIQLFKKVAADASDELRLTEVKPHILKAEQLTTDINHEFQTVADAAAKAVRDAQADFDKLIAAGIRKGSKFDEAASLLVKATQNQVSGLRFAREQQEFRLQSVDIEKQIAAANNLKIKEQEIGLVTAENRRVRQEQLAVIQAINIEIGKGLQQLKASENAANQFLEATAKTRPRTDLEISGSAIQSQRTKFTFDIAEAQGRLKGLETQFDAMTDEISHGNFAIIGAQEELKKLFPIREAEIQKLKELQEKGTELAEHLRAFALSFSVIDNAVLKTTNTLLDALLGSFEGKKTDFVTAFKGITDQIFKDSLHNAVQALQKTARDAFEGIFDSLNIKDSMAKTLGPAFLAGFALIASFVLGQLLQNKGGTASPSNPSIGVQSSEQVRGIIGGATQIPIGAVAQSLQEALQPTNGLLTRIAIGIERLGPGSSAADVDHFLSQAFGSTLQTQGG